MKLISILAGAALAASTFTASADGIMVFQEYHNDKSGLLKSQFAMLKGKGSKCEELHRAGLESGTASPLTKRSDGTYVHKLYGDGGYVLVKCQPLSMLTVYED